MLSQVVFHSGSTNGGQLRGGSGVVPHTCSSAAITTFFRFVETPQFDRDSALLGERIAHGYLHVFNLIADVPTTFRGEY